MNIRSVLLQLLIISVKKRFESTANQYQNQLMDE